MGGSRMHHRRTSNVHDHADAALRNPILLRVTTSLLFLAPGPPQVDPLPPQGPAPSGVSQVDPPLGTVPVEVAIASGADRGAVSWGAAYRGAEPGGAEFEGAGSGGVEPGGAEPEGVEHGGAESEGAESGVAEPRGTASCGGPAGASP
ncbi:unnamed protein product [Closterium sp. NIES-54]